MRKILALLLFFCLPSLGAEGIKISDLPLLGGASVDALDSFPALDASAGRTVRIRVGDLFLVPSLAAQLAPFAGKMTNPMTTVGDIIYGGSSGLPTRLAAGTLGYVLTSNGPGTPPSYAPSGGGITALTNEVTASGSGSVVATVANSAVIAKVLTGFASGAGTVTSSDSILQAFNKLVGNMALLAPLASPTFTGTVTASTFSGNLLGNATTATALAANPTDCSAGQFATAIAANGNLTCATPAGGATWGSITGSGAQAAPSGGWTGTMKLDTGSSGTPALTFGSGETFPLRIWYNVPSLGLDMNLGGGDGLRFMSNGNNQIESIAGDFTLKAVANLNLIVGTHINLKGSTWYDAGLVYHGNLAAETDNGGCLGCDFDGLETGNRFAKGIFGTKVVSPQFVGSLVGNASGSAATFTGNLTGPVTSTGMATSIVDAHRGFFDGTAISDKCYTVDEYSPYAYTVNSFVSKSSAGTVTIAAKINGSSMTGISACSVTSTQGTCTASAANSVAAGDRVEICASSTSSAANVAWTMKFTR